MKTEEEIEKFKKEVAENIPCHDHTKAEYTQGVLDALLWVLET